MNISKFFAAIAVPAVSLSAFAAAGFSADAADDTIAVAGICGLAGPYSYWNENENTGNLNVKTANITCDGQYEARWELSSGDGTSTVEFLCIEVKKPEEAELDITSENYPDLSLRVDEIIIDGEAVEFTDVPEAYDLMHYEASGKDGSRAYLVANWGVNDDVDLGISKDQTITASIIVKFTVSGLSTEEETTAPPVTSEAAEETTSITTSEHIPEETSVSVSGTDVTGNEAGTVPTVADNGYEEVTGVDELPAEPAAPTGDTGTGIAAAALLLAAGSVYAAKRKK